MGEDSKIKDYLSSILGWSWERERLLALLVPFIGTAILGAGAGAVGWLRNANI